MNFKKWIEHQQLLKIMRIRRKKSQKYDFINKEIISSN